MTVYLIYIVAVILVGWYLLGDRITEKQRLWCLVGTGVVLVALMTLRYAIGYDYFSYKGLVETTSAISIPQIFTTYKVEFMFYLISWVVTTLGGGYHVVLLLCNLIMVGCVIWVIYKNSSLWWLSAVLYVALQFMPHSMNLLRQSIAASIAFAGWEFLKKGKFWQYALVILLAATFHMSVLIMIPAYFFMRMPYKPAVLIAYGGAITVAYVAFTPLLRFFTTYVFPKYAVYLSLDIYSQKSSFSTAVVPMLCFVLVLLFSPDMVARKKTNGILVYAMLFAFTASAFITQMYIIERFSIYFFMYAMLALPEVVMIYKPAPEETAVLAAGQKPSKQNAKPPATKKQKQTQSEYMGMIALILAGSLIYLGYAARLGYHKTYPYVGLWEQQNAVDNDKYYADHMDALN